MCTDGHGGNLYSPFDRGDGPGNCELALSRALCIYGLNPAGSLEDLLDGSSYGLQNGKGQLVGFYQFGREARILTKEPGAYPQGSMDLGLGLAPHLCGLSLGHRGGHELCSEGAESGKLSADSGGMESTGQKGFLCCGFVPSKTLTHALFEVEFFQMEK